MREAKPIRLLLLTALVVLTTAVAHAQSSDAPTIRLQATAVDDDATPLVADQIFPQISFALTPTTAAGIPLTNLDRSHFSLTEAGQPVTDFTVAGSADPDAGVAILFVLDLAAAGRTDINQFKQALVSLYDVLTTVDQSGLIFFARSGDTAVNLDDPFPQLDATREITFTSDEGALINLINTQQLIPDAGSPLYDALFKAIRITAQADHPRRAVFVVSDGVDAPANGSGLASQYVNLDTAVAEAQTLGIPLFTASWGVNVNEVVLQQLADSSGGAYQADATAAGLQQFLTNTVTQLRHTYRLSFTSNLQADNEQHPLIVNVGNVAAVELPFTAYYPLTPQVRGVTAVLPDAATPADLASLGAVRGSVDLIPNVIARHPITAVNYYIDDSQAAAATRTTDPWTFTWDTTSLSPDQSHNLTIEVIDNASPPNVGVYETAVFVTACPLLCQMELTLGFTPLWLLLGLLVVALAGAIFLRQRQTATADSQPTHAQPAHSPPTPSSPTPGRGAATPPFTPRQEPLAPTPSLPVRPVSTPAPSPAADAPKIPRPPTGETAKTEVLNTGELPIAKLVDVATENIYPVPANATIGRDDSNTIMLDDDTVAAQHVRVTWENGRFIAINLATDHPTRLNQAPLQRHELTDNDRLHLGNRVLVFRKID